MNPTLREVSCGALAIALCSQLAPAQIDPCPTWNGWTNAQPGPAPAIDPDVDVSGDHVHVAWSSFAPTNGVFYTRSTDGGQTYSTPVRVPGSDAARSPTVAAHGSTVVITMAEGNALGGRVLVSRSTDGGASFDAASQLHDSSIFTAFDPRVEVDRSTGTFHVTWWGTSGPSLDNVRYSRSRDGRIWKTALDLSQTPGDASRRSDVAVTEGKVMVTWREERQNGTDILARISDDDGTSFGPAARVASLDNERISTGPRADASGSGRNATFAVTYTDLRITFGRSQADTYLRATTDGGVTWDAEVDLSGTPDGVSRLPAVAVLGDTIVVIWQERLNGSFETVMSCSDDRGRRWTLPAQISPGAGSSAGTNIALGHDLAAVVVEEAAGLGTDPLVNTAPIRARIATVGSGGCGSGGGTPTLRARGDLSGASALRFEIGGMPAGASFALGISAGQATPPIVLGGCLFDLDPTVLVAINGIADQSGAMAFDLPGPFPPLLVFLQAVGLRGQNLVMTVTQRIIMD